MLSTEKNWIQFFKLIQQMLSSGGILIIFLSWHQNILLYDFFSFCRAARFFNSAEVFQLPTSNTHVNK
jgi:hypothetical protein